MSSALELDPLRLARDLAEFGSIGGTGDGGIRRLALSREDDLARTALIERCGQLGLHVRCDTVGNLFARKPGTAKSAEAVGVGSHLDSQVTGGRYDGALGVLVGLELLRTLVEHDVEHVRPVDLVCWSAEEGSRFLPPMLGSSAWAGALSEEAALRSTEPSGLNYADALNRMASFHGAEPVGQRPLSRYFELHIEQGPVLDRGDADVAVVEGGYPTIAVEVTVKGIPSHSGPTPMEDRRSSLVGAARLIEALESLTLERGPDFRSTTTRIENWPNRAGVVPAETRLLADFRHSSAHELAEMHDDFRRSQSEVGEALDLDVSEEVVYEFGGMSFDTEAKAVLRTALTDRGTPFKSLSSWAAHDAYAVAGRSPAAMLFCPCVGGISHSPGEEIEIDRVIPAANALLDAVLVSANSLP